MADDPRPLARMDKLRRWGPDWADMVRLSLLLISIVASFVVAWLALTGPKPLPANAPEQEFSAARAMADVEKIAVRPHPVGSPEDAQVRDYLVQRMSALGLVPRVQTAEAISEKTHLPVSLGNIIGVLPGRDGAAPAVAVMAHYDSTPRGPGAADDAAGVAAVLEIARALKTAGASARDVLFILTDGEEAGMLGAKALFAGDPAARRIGFVVNLEARGSQGRAMMFETGQRNGETIRLFARSAQRPLSDSLMVLVYELMPNYTDFTEGKKAGLQGLNFAFLGGAGDYHAASDTPANLDQRSLQDIGAQSLAAVRAAANEPLPQPADDLVYSDVLGLGVLAYPAWVGWMIVAASAGLLGVGAVGSGLRGRDMAAGLGLSLLLLLASGALFYAAGAILAGLKIRTSTNLQSIEVVGFVVAIGLLAGWAALGRRGLFGGPPDPVGVWAGMLATGIVLAIAVQVMAPAAGPVIAWPVATACAMAALTQLGSRGPWSLIAVAILAVPVLGFVTTVVHLTLLSLLTPLGLAPWPWMAALLLAPLLAGPRPSHAPEGRGPVG
jgi:hypothetical protein